MDSGDTEIEELFSSVLAALECMQNDKTPICYTDALYEQAIDQKAFSDWLYNFKSQPELSTFKRELSIRINKGTRMNEEEYDSFLEKIEQQCCPDELAISVHTGTDNPLYVATPMRYWGAKQWYLGKYVKLNDFPSDVVGCFPNLFFHKHVASSMNTLNADFSVERPMIVRHLQALNDFKLRFSPLQQKGAGYREMGREFEMFSKIECTPQSDRDAAKKLDFSFTNQLGEPVTLRCELHTKLKWNDMDKEKQDRIYFHPGNPDIEDGKVLIVHIGTHQ
jgi:hypothetical protein